MTEICTEWCAFGGECSESFHGNRIPVKRSTRKADLEKHKRIIGDLAASKIFFLFSFYVFFCPIWMTIKTLDMNSAIILLKKRLALLFYDFLPWSFEVKLKRERVVDGGGARLCAWRWYALFCPLNHFFPLSLLPPPLPFPLTLIKSASLAWLPKIIGVGFGCHLLEMSPVSFFF